MLDLIGDIQMYNTGRDGRNSVTVHGQWTLSLPTNTGARSYINTAIATMKNLIPHNLIFAFPNPLRFCNKSPHLHKHYDVVQRL